MQGPKGNKEKREERGQQWTPAAEAAQSVSRAEPEIKKSALKYEGTELKIRSQ